HDGREEHDEAPEDERVHQPRDQPLQQLLLAERDHRLLPGPCRYVVEPRRRLPPAHHPHQQRCPASEQRPRRGHVNEQRDPRQPIYPPASWRSSAVIAGITSWRSPITA